MPKWFDEAFGAVIGEVGAAITDIRSKLVEEAFWGRKVPEASARGEHGMSPAGGERGLLDRLSESHPDLFATAPGEQAREADHNLER